MTIEKQSSAHSTIRKRKIDQKIKLINFNQSSFMKDMAEKNHSKI